MSSEKQKPNVKNIYLIDDEPLRYIAKLESLHRENKFTNINIIIKKPEITEINSIISSVEKIFAEAVKNANAILLDNFFRVHRCWIYTIIEKSEKIKKYLQQFNKTGGKVIIFSNQGSGVEKTKLIKALREIGLEYIELSKANADDEAWIIELENLLDFK